MEIEPITTGFAFKNAPKTNFFRACGELKHKNMSKTRIIQISPNPGKVNKGGVNPKGGGGQTKCYKALQIGLKKCSKWCIYLVVTCYCHTGGCILQ